MTYESAHFRAVQRVLAESMTESFLALRKLQWELSPETLHLAGEHMTAWLHRVWVEEVPCDAGLDFTVNVMQGVHDEVIILLPKWVEALIKVHAPSPISYSKEPA